jgi:hypothetical protein
MLAKDTLYSYNHKTVKAEGRMSENIRQQFSVLCCAELAQPGCSTRVCR